MTDVVAVRKIHRGAGVDDVTCGTNCLFTWSIFALDAPANFGVPVDRIREGHRFGQRLSLSVAHVDDDLAGVARRARAHEPNAAQDSSHVRFPISARRCRASSARGSQQLVAFAQRRRRGCAVIRAALRRGHRTPTDRCFSPACTSRIESPEYLQPPPVSEQICSTSSLLHAREIDTVKRSFELRIRSGLVDQFIDDGGDRCVCHPCARREKRAATAAGGAATLRLRRRQCTRWLPASRLSKVSFVLNPACIMGRGRAQE